MYIPRTMASKPRHEEIKAIMRRLRDELFREELTPKLTGSLEKFSV